MARRRRRPWASTPRAPGAVQRNKVRADERNDAMDEALQRLPSVDGIDEIVTSLHLLMLGTLEAKEAQGGQCQARSSEGDREEASTPRSASGVRDDEGCTGA
ncbi:hypothetical protein ACP70R_011355 [Stipagrostis hirtigluma subsp. patula]